MSFQPSASSETPADVGISGRKVAEASTTSTLHFNMSLSTCVYQHQGKAVHDLTFFFFLALTLMSTRKASILLFQLGTLSTGM